MKSLALFGFIVLGAVTAHRLADSEAPLFLNDEDIVNVKNAKGMGRIDESLCVFEADQSIYNLNNLRGKDSDYVVDLIDGESSINQFKVVFNFCNDIVDTDKKFNCPAKTKSAIIQKTDNDTNYICHPIANESAHINVQLSPPRNRPEFNYTPEVLKNDLNNGRLKITYTQRNICPIPQSTEDVSLVLNMICDPKAAKPVLTNASIETGLCNAKIQVRSQHACFQFTLNPLFKWIDE